MALAEQFLSVEICDFFPSALGIAMQGVFIPYVTISSTSPASVAFLLHRHNSFFSTHVRWSSLPG